MSIKQELYNQCIEFVNNRLKTIQSTIYDIKKAMLTETKSSAGDKHETGRAMLQLEREKTGNQLSEINKLKETLSRIELEKDSSIISLGSIAYTSKSNYYIAISAGELKAGDQLFYAVSPNTPIGKLLLGKKVGDEIIFKSERFIITETT